MQDPKIIEEVLNAQKTVIGQIALTSLRENSHHFFVQAKSLRLQSFDFYKPWEPIFHAMEYLHGNVFPLTPANIIERLREENQLQISALKTADDFMKLPVISEAEGFAGPGAKANEFARLVEILKERRFASSADSLWTLIDSVKANKSMQYMEKFNLIHDRISLFNAIKERSNVKNLNTRIIHSKIDIDKHFSNPAPRAYMLFEGCRAGNIGAVIGPGGSGKSFLSLELAYAVACGKDAPAGDVLKISPGGQAGRVVFFTAEDTEDLIWERQEAISAFLHPEARKLIIKNLDIIPTYGTNVDLLDPDIGYSNVNTIIEYCKGARLIILDPLICFHQVDENDNGAMARLMNTFKHIVDETKATLLFTHHTAKIATLNKEKQDASQTSARGASSLSDLVRFMINLFPLSESLAKEYGIDDKDKRCYVVYQPVKINGASFPEKRFFKRAEGGVLVPVVMEPTPKTTKNNERNFDEKEI